MALNTPENVSRLIQKLVEAVNAGRDIGSLVADIGLDDDDARSVIKTLTKRIGDLSTISRLSKRINELELNIQGTSTSEQNRIARDAASRNKSSIKRQMSFYEQLEGIGYKLDSRGNLIEASRYDYLRQKYYNRYAEFGDDGEVENISEASRIASILARRQVRNEREEEERKRQEKENAEKVSRQEANIGARGRYRDAMREIHDPSHMERRRLYESFLEVDESTGKSSLDQRKAAAKKAMEVLATEKANTKGVNENTKALTGLRAYLGPFAKIALPYYSVKAIYDSLSSNTEASVQRVKRRTFGGIYGTNKDRGHFKRMAHTMGSYGASMRDIRSEYANQKKWASVLEFGMGMDKIEAIAMILGKAPGPAEIKDEDKMQEWLAKNLYGISDHQARQLSALGVASDTFIESARKGSATDMIGEAARIRSSYEDLNKQIGVQENPFRKLEYTIGENLAESIAHGGIRGFVTEFGMGVLDKFGAVWQWLDNIGANEYDKRDQHALIPNQNNVTVNLYGNIDSEERAHSFAEQIGAEVSNAEK